MRADEQEEQEELAVVVQQGQPWPQQRVGAKSRTAACHHRVTRAGGIGSHVLALRALFQDLPLAAMWQTLAVEAAFTPRTRAELQGDGTAGGGGVFGCVGKCGQSLSGSSGNTYCSSNANGPWESGDGTTCANADSDVPSGQGDGKYGAIGSWNVGKVTNMQYSECTTVHPCVVFLMSPPSLSLFHF